MAAHLQMRSEPELEERMRGFYQTLSEKDRRRYAALEARRLGRGGIRYVAEVLGCSRRTIERAASEVLSLPMFPELTGPQCQEVAGAVRDLAQSRKAFAT